MSWRWTATADLIAGGTWALGPPCPLRPHRTALACGCGLAAMAALVRGQSDPNPPQLSLHKVPSVLGSVMCQGGCPPTSLMSRYFYPEWAGGGVGPVGLVEGDSSPGTQWAAALASGLMQRERGTLQRSPP